MSNVKTLPRARVYAGAKDLFKMIYVVREADTRKRYAKLLTMCENTITDGSNQEIDLAYAFLEVIYREMV